MQHAAIEQRLQNLRHAADIVDVLGDVVAARLQVGDVGRALEDLGDCEQVEIDSGLVRHGGQVQCCVGRTAGRRHDNRRVLEGFPRGDVARTDAAREQVHDGLAALERVDVAAFVWRRCAGGAGERKPDRLGNAGHGVGGELPAA